MKRIALTALSRAFPLVPTGRERQETRNVFGRQSRHGVASLWTLAVLGVVGLVTALIVSQLLAGRRWLDHRANQVEAGWLARAGVELAVARLLTDPAPLAKESVEPIPGSKVTIEVQRDPKAAGTYLVTSTAQYPAEGPGIVQREVTRRLRRVLDKDQVRIEFVHDMPAQPAR